MAVHLGSLASDRKGRLLSRPPAMDRRTGGSVVASVAHHISFRIGHFITHGASLIRSLFGWIDNELNNVSWQCAVICVVAVGVVLLFLCERARADSAERRATTAERRNQILSKIVDLSKVARTRFQAERTRFQESDDRLQQERDAERTRFQENDDRLQQERDEMLQAVTAERTRFQAMLQAVTESDDRRRQERDAERTRFQESDDRRRQERDDPTARCWSRQTSYQESAAGACHDVTVQPLELPNSSDICASTGEPVQVELSVCEVSVHSGAQPSSPESDEVDRSDETAQPVDETQQPLELLESVELRDSSDTGASSGGSPTPCMLARLPSGVVVQLPYVQEQIATQDGAGLHAYRLTNLPTYGLTTLPSLADLSTTSENNSDQQQPGNTDVKELYTAPHDNPR
eukprot:GHVQ01004887.1.p1 GENE.GHVQ01004887.1~~GHVQ01004887.1.p1  ORF type:complete len:404 (+),score=49.94 GHVQ01004887.1:316-1527(+)